MAQEYFLEPVMPDIIEQWKCYLNTLNVQPDDVILDVGCNTGDTEQIIVNLYPYINKVIGLDYDEKRINKAIEKWKTRGRTEKIQFIQGDGAALPFEANIFDKIICAETLEWIKDPLKAIKEIYRVLKPNGIALIQHTDWDMTAFTASDIQLTRKIIQSFGDSGPDGIIGRKLLGYCKQVGFTEVTPSVYALINDKFEAPFYSYKLAMMIKDWLLVKDLISREDIEKWISDMAIINEKGEFFFSINRNLFICVK